MKNNWGKKQRKAQQQGLVGGGEGKEQTTAYTVIIEAEARPSRRAASYELERKRERENNIDGGSSTSVSVCTYRLWHIRYYGVCVTENTHTHTHR